MPALAHSEIETAKVLPDIKTTGTEGSTAKYGSNLVGGKSKKSKGRKSKKSRSRKSKKSRSRKSKK
jgi:hypothetical protein